MTESQSAASYAGREIALQPEAWAQAAARVSEVAQFLPRSGERVAVIGCGTSWFMAAAYAAMREELGGGETDAFAAGQWPAGRGYDRVVAISRSGTTTEILQAIAATTSPVTVITAVPDSPVVAEANDTIALEFADEVSVVQTVFATTALTLLRASLSVDVQAAIAQAGSILSGGSPLAPSIYSARQFTFLGTGWGVGIASEAGLKMREAARAWTESYPQLEYRHGPISIAEPGRVVWVFGPLGSRPAPRYRGHRSADRERRSRPARRSHPGAAAGGTTGRRAGFRPGPAAQPDPVRRPRGFGLTS